MATLTNRPSLAETKNQPTVTHSMDQSCSWEADSRSAGEEVYHFLQNPEVNNRFRKSPLLVLFWETWIQFPIYA